MGVRVSPTDAVWYSAEDPQNPMTISSVLWLDGALDLDRLRRLIEERVLAQHPVFQQRIVPSRLPGVLPRWEDVEQLDLDAHLRVVDLPSPGEHALLEARCSLERSTPLDRSRPLWSITIYRGYRQDGTAIHTRIHHSLGDGIALMRLLLTLCDEHQPGGDEEQRGRDEHDQDASSSLLPGLLELGQQTIEAAYGHALHPTRFLSTAGRAVSTAGWAARLLMPALVEPNILHGTPHGTKRMTWDPDGFPLEELKAAGRDSGATVNDLLLTIAAGGLHRYLAEREALVDDVTVFVPVDLRASTAQLPRHLGNQIGLLPVILPVRSPDPVERLATIRERMAQLKDSPAPWVSRMLLAGTSLATPVIERGLHRFTQLRSTGVITNVPGPSRALHLAGARLQGAVGWGGMTGRLNLSAAFISLGGRVFPGLVTDTAITEDPDQLLVHLEDEWHATLAALSPGGSGADARR